MAIDDSRLVPLPKIEDERGNLTSVESCVQVPFGISRVYYLYDVPGGSERGGHAHKTLKQLIVAVAGSFDVHIDDGESQRTFHLNRANVGLYLAPMTWRSIDNFSSGSVCLVLASAPYDEADYIRDPDQFKQLCRVAK